jgi:hypothetical protein
MLFRPGCALALLFAAATSMAAPAHYIVFGIDAQQRVQAQFHTVVELADAPAGIDPPALLPGKRLPDGGALLQVRGERDKRIVMAVSISVPGSLRGESVDAGGHLQATVAAGAQRSFVVRAPLDTEVLRIDMGAGEQRIDLDALMASARTLPLAALTPTAGKATLPAGNPANRVDVLLLGDGFVTGEEPRFNALADEVTAGFFSIPPYLEYRKLVNVSRLFVPSSQSGADHPPYSAGCRDDSCCADAAANGDARAGMFRDTAFDAKYCTAQIHRLVTVDIGKVLVAASAAPNWDHIVVVVNDPVYGGSGGLLSVLSAHDSAVLLAAHEWGHSFTNLADEYVTEGFVELCSDWLIRGGCPPNITDRRDPASVKWRAWFTPGIPIPTPAGNPGVGLFEGAGQATGFYRPADDCLMRTLGSSGFCPVCSESYVLKLYRGGFGVPLDGVDLIEPGTESPSPYAHVIYRVGSTQRFAASIVRPDVAGIEVQWLLDGVPIDGAHGESFDFAIDSPVPSKHLLQLRVTDRSKFLNPARLLPEATHLRSWRILVRDAVRPKGGKRVE